LEKESAMKTGSEKSARGKVTGWPLVALVVVGGALLAGVADLSGKTDAMSRLFVFFLGAIIVIQVIPAMMLFSAMFKGIASIFNTKEKVHSRK
jgi:hypothetical protein